MSGLHDAFDEIVADVPVYGDIDRAIEQADLEQRRRYGLLAGLAAAAAIAAIIGVLTITDNGNRSEPPVGPSPSPTPDKSQSPQTWVDTAVDATRDESGWNVKDPLKAARDAWFAAVAEHLDPKGDRLTPQEGGGFERSGEGSEFSSSGRVGLVADRGGLNLFDNGCGYVRAGRHGYPDEQVSCTTERIAGPDGERAKITRYQRMCGSWDPGREGDDARPGPGETYATCGEYVVAVAVERGDGLIGYVEVDGRGTTDFNPFAPAALAAAAADPQLTLPETAYAVPSDQALMSVAEDHFPRYKVDDQVPSATDHPGLAHTSGKLGRPWFSVTVQPAGATPVCGRRWLIECVERRVFGADDPTTVFVGAWENGDLGDAFPKNSRSSSRELVYVGPHHTVVVSLGMLVKADEGSLGADLDQRMIDLLLDPRLQ